MNFVHNSNQIAYYDASQKLLAEVTFPAIDGQTVDVNHTFVDDSLRGQGIAGQLMEELVKQLRFENKKAVLSCSYAISWFGKHKEEYSDILK